MGTPATPSTLKKSKQIWSIYPSLEELKQKAKMTEEFNLDSLMMMVQQIILNLY